jgi:pyruvate-formate lyase-activating enzyme
MATFIDELIREAEERDEKLSLEYADLILVELKGLEEEIQKTFEQASKEREIIKNWALKKNSKLTERIEFLSKKLEAFLKETNMKTLDLPNGVLKFRKQPDAVEVTNLEEFLKHAKESLVTTIPQQVKPDLNKIKAFIKTRPTPPGVTVIEGKVEFSYKLKNGKEPIDGPEET